MERREYILRFIYNHYSEYYGGGSYIANGEKYACLYNYEEAKRYSSIARAKNAYDKLRCSCMNVPLECEIIEYKEGRIGKVVEKIKISKEMKGKLCLNDMNKQ